MSIDYQINCQYILNHLSKGKRVNTTRDLFDERPIDISSCIMNGSSFECKVSKDSILSLIISAHPMLVTGKDYKKIEILMHDATGMQLSSNYIFDSDISNVKKQIYLNNIVEFCTAELSRCIDFKIMPNPNEQLNVMIGIQYRIFILYTDGCLIDSIFAGIAKLCNEKIFVEYTNSLTDLYQFNLRYIPFYKSFCVISNYILADPTLDELALASQEIQILFTKKNGKNVILKFIQTGGSPKKSDLLLHIMERI